MYVGAEHHPELASLARRQRGVATMEQLERLGLSRSQVRANIQGRRWTQVGHHSVLLQNRPADRVQVMWATTLDVEGPIALASHTALELWGFRSFAKEAAGIHVVVPHGAKVAGLPSLVVHESRRFGEVDVRRTNGLPCTERARSAIDAAAWQPWPRFAMAMMAAAVQQRICHTDELEAALVTVGRVRHKAYLRLALRDIAGGAEALSEIDMAALCRRHRLRPPDRQVLRRDPSGRRRYLDCEWVLEDGTRVVLEIDGAHHLDVAHWEADIKRERKVVITRRIVLRATSAEMRLESLDVVKDLIAVGVPRT
jgi:hypothetical protein